MNNRVTDTAAALGYGVLFCGVAATVSSRRSQRLDDAVRRLQDHPRRGVRHAIAEGIKVAAKPEVQLRVAAIVTLFLHRARVRNAGVVVSSALAVVAMQKYCKRWMPRRRPPGYRGDQPMQSFPSGHTATAAAFAFTLARVLDREGITRPARSAAIALLATAVVGESRLVLDDHWPMDVLGGALLGGAVTHGTLAIAKGAPCWSRATPRGLRHRVTTRA